MTWIRLVLPGALVLALAPSSPLAAQAAGTTGTVTGRVTLRADTSAAASALAAPARGATLTLVVAGGAARGATANADGRWTIDRVPAGAHVLRVRLLGYRTTERTILVPAGDTARVDLVLLRQPQLLSRVRTEARSSEAETFVAKPNVATVTLDAAAMRGVPSVGEPDVARVVQLLPGVVARNDFNSGLNVRGGEADQNLILLDGHPIYNPFHLGGMFSTFMDATVAGIELRTGAFPARYGGRLSSVLDVRSAEEARPGMHGSADLSVLAASGRLAGSFGGERGRWSVAARRTYVDAVAAAFTDDVLPYHFHDMHGRASYDLPGDVRLAFTAYSGTDVLDVDLAEIEGDSIASSARDGRYAFEWGNRVGGLTLTKELGADVRLLGWRFGEGTTLEQRVSFSDFSMRLDLGEGAFAQHGRTRDLRVAGSVLARGRRHDRAFGYELATQRTRFAAGATQTGTNDFDLAQRPSTAAAWVEDLWRVTPRLLVEGGLRAEALSGRQWAALSPRVSVKFVATPALAFTAATGRVTQTMHSLTGDGPMRFFDVWISSDEHIPVATAWHWVAGAERRFGDAASLKLETFLKRYDRVLESNLSNDPVRRGDEFFVVQGRSYGVDVLARWQPRGALSGWVAWTYGVSARWRDTLRWAPSQDRRHDVDAVATWRLAKYRLGAHVGVASGTPYTPIVGEVARRVWDPSRDRWGTGDARLYVEPLGGRRNSARFPVTHRLDLDASREFALRGATVSPYVSVVNAYNARNVFVYRYNYSTAFPRRRAISQFPVLPSVGVRVAF